MAGVGACGIVDPTDGFSWALSPDRAETAVGELVDFQVRVFTKTNINNDVELEPGVVPDGFTVTLPTGMGSTQETADGTVYVSPAVEVGEYEVQIRAREVGREFSSRLILVTVTSGSADFSLEVDPETITMQPGSGHVFAYRVTPFTGFSGTVALTLAGLADDLVLDGQGLSAPTLDFPPGSSAKGGTVLLYYRPEPPVASPVQLTLTATSGTILHTRTITLTLAPPNTNRLVIYNGSARSLNLVVGSEVPSSGNLVPPNTTREVQIWSDLGAVVRVRAMESLVEQASVSCTVTASAWEDHHPQVQVFGDAALTMSCFDF
jgi:hypothetical protein